MLVIEQRQPILQKSLVAVSYTHLDVYKRQARALARKPEILIFDDSFSALDYKTDRVPVSYTHL